MYCMFYLLEKEMATHSSVPAWRIPGAAEPGGLPSKGSHRVGHDCSDLAAVAAAVFLIYSVFVLFLSLHFKLPLREGFLSVLFIALFSKLEECLAHSMDSVNVCLSKLVNNYPHKT